MKNILRYMFIITCMAICILPFAGMAVCPTDKTTENRKMAEFPNIIKKNGRININFLQELGDYFRDHFAFRLELVSADAEIQSKIFKVSNADSVITGNDGWLYYASTVDDYLGKNIMTERKIKNIAHNLILVQQYVEAHGAKFIFTVPPNKNTLYGENMPYYLQYKIKHDRNIDILEQEIRECKISYCDLFSLFKGQKEVLYLKRDSHWNNKGAVLAYNAILDKLGLEHDNYNNVSALRQKNEYGDLGNMLYPITAKPEWNYFYEKKNTFSYVSDDSSDRNMTAEVEKAWIETENSQGFGKLLMFRDSFGNTLLPLMADTFSNGYFSKGVPQNVAGYVETYSPDVVILEKVERNINEIAEEPPLVEGEAADLENDIEDISSKTSLMIEESENNISYLEVSGVLDSSLCDKDTNIYIRVTDSTGQTDYHVLYVTNQETDYGYKLYLQKEKINEDETLFEVIVENDNKFQVVKKIAGKKWEDNGPKIVSKEKIYDCDGSGHGYYLIKWSDGREEYEDF